MDRTRRIAAAPVRPSHEAWAEVKKLVAVTLEKSKDVPAGSVVGALTPLDGVASSLVASGYFAGEPLVVVAGDLRLAIHTVGGDGAFTVEENLDPVPGGGSAPATWKLFVPSPKHLRETVKAACDGHAHLVSGKAPATISASAGAGPSRAIEAGSRAKNYQIKADALRQFGGRA